MSQTILTIFDPNEVVQDTMEQLIEENTLTLRSNFEGSSPPTFVGSQFFSDTNDNKLKIYQQTGGTPVDWLDLYNFATDELEIRDGQIKTEQISYLARKGSIVTTQNIAPASCTLQAKFKEVSLISVPCNFYPLYNSPGSTSGAGVLENEGPAFTTVINSKIYVPDGAGTLYGIFYQVTCDVRFVVGSITSTNAGVVVGPAWGSTEAYIDTSLLTGDNWYDFEIQALSTVSFPGPAYGGIGGAVFRWEV